MLLRSGPSFTKAYRFGSSATTVNLYYHIDEEVRADSTIRDGANNQEKYYAIRLP